MKRGEPTPWQWLIAQAESRALHATMMGDASGAAGELAFADYCQRRRAGELLKPGEPDIPELAIKGN